MAELPPIKPVVAEISPDIYNALKNAGATQQEQNIVEQVSFAYKKGMDLRKLDTDHARIEYGKLAPQAKLELKTVFPNEKYMQPKPGLWTDIANLGKAAWKGVLSPVGVGGYALAGEYSKLINAPGRATFETTTAKQPLFSGKTWSVAHNGKDLYNPNDLQKLTDQYGEANIAVAKGIVAGNSFGEILSSYNNGQPSPDLFNAIASSLDDPKYFTPIIDAVKMARFAPGRSAVRQAYDYNEATQQGNGSIVAKLTRAIMGQPPKVYQMVGQTDAAYKKQVYEVNKNFKNKASGAIDGLYQVLIDPLTYLTMGGSKEPMLGAKLNESLKASIANNNLEKGVADVFKEPTVQQLWNNSAGPAIKQYAEAKTAAERSVALNKIKEVAPGYYHIPTIETMASKEHQVYDAASAQKFFENAKNTSLLGSGRVDGTTFYRNGVATARNQRHLSGGIAAVADAMFNPIVGKSSVRQTVQELQAQGKQAFEILAQVGKIADQGVNPAIADLTKYDKDISRLQRLGFRIGNLAARNAGRGVILYGEDAYKTLPTLVGRLRMIVPRDMAEVLGQLYREASKDEQIAFVRNMYAARMQQAGLEGIQQGKNFITKVLDRTFNDRGGFGTTPVTEVSNELAGVMSKHSVQWNNDVAVVPNRGAIHPFQLTDAIGSLDEIALDHMKAIAGYKQAVKGIKEGKITHTTIPDILDGVHKSKLVKEYTDFWAWGTLFPRLGIRGSSDEIFQFLLTAPVEDVSRFLMGGGRKEGRVLSMFAGSPESTGITRRMFHKAFGKGDPSKYLTVADRQKIIDDLAAELSSKLGRDVSIEELSHLQIRAATAQRAWDSIFRGAKTADKQHIIEAMMYSPHFMDGQVSALTARTSMSGKFAADEFKNPMFSLSAIDKASEDLGIDITRNFDKRSVADLKKVNNRWLTLAHFDNFLLRFAHNTVDIAGKRFSPVEAFFANKGIRSGYPDDMERATKMLLKDVGVEYKDSIDFEVKNEERLHKFVNEFGYTSYHRQAGLSDVEIARIHIETMLADLRLVFHGGKDAYNQKLMNLINEHRFDLNEEEARKGFTIKNKWEKAIGRIDFADFEKATIDHQPTGEINTRLNFPGFEGEEQEGGWSRFKNFTLEAMDKQVNSIFRQPALEIVYTRLRREYKGLENAVRKQQVALISEADPFMPKAQVEAQARENAARWATGHAMENAASSLLKYADNPAVRSNFSVSIRMLGRFFRANEDFQRRIYRTIKERPLTSLYRIKLAHHAIDASGSIYQDQQGKDYFVFPGDVVLNTAVAAVVGQLYDNPQGNTFKVPQFDDIKMKLELSNPSFANDAGQPMLGGPLAGVIVTGFKAILGSLPERLQPGATKAGEALNNVALGPIGSNVSIRKALVPMFFDNIYKALSPYDANREYVSAGISAIAYMQAFGQKLPPNPTDEEKYNYQKAIRIGTHNVLVVRAILGLGPINPSLQESKGLPDYYKNIGAISLRGEFYKILQSVKDTYGTDVQDPYALATAIFCGKNPGLLVDTVSRSDKNYKVLVNMTQEVKDWATKHQSFIDKHGDAAWVFAPQIGQFNTNVYTWMQGQNLISSKSMGDYLIRAMTSEQTSTYFGIGAKEKEDLAKTSDLSLRQDIIKQATQDRQDMLASNPYLAKAIQPQTGGGKSQDEITLEGIRQVLQEPDAPINKTDKKFMKAAIQEMDSLTTYAQDPYVKDSGDAAVLKSERRQIVEANIKKLALLSPAVNEAYAYVFKAIMNSYAPEKNLVLEKGQ